MASKSVAAVAGLSVKEQEKRKKHGQPETAGFECQVLEMGPQQRGRGASRTGWRSRASLGAEDSGLQVPGPTLETVIRETH